MYWYLFFLTFCACVLRGAMSGKISKSDKPLALALKSLSAKFLKLIALNRNRGESQEESGAS